MKPSEMQVFRRKRNISVMEVAAMTGLPQTYIEQIEEGVVQPSETDMNRILKALWRIEANRKVKDDSPDLD